MTAAGALIGALTELEVSRIGFCSPYTRELNEEAMGFLRASGFEVVSNAYIGADLGNDGQGDVTPEQVVELAMRADSREAQAIVLSCTDMRAVEVIKAIEGAAAKPVVTSNQALMFAAVKRLGLQASVPGALGDLSETRA